MQNAQFFLDTGQKSCYNEENAFFMKICRLIGRKAGAVMSFSRILNNICAAAAAAVLLLTVSGCTGGAEKDDSLQKVLDAGTLVLGLDTHYPPMGYIDENGDTVGFDIDLAQEVCDRLGIRLVTHPIIWSEKEQELNSGTIDCIWNGLSMSPEREKIMRFSIPYIRNELVFVVRSDSDIRSTEDISGKTVGVQAGSTTEDVLEGSELADRNEIAKYEDNMELMQSMKQGDIDVTFIDSVNAYYYISMSEEGFYVLPDSLFEDNYAVGFRLEDRALCSQINKTLSDMKADGTLREISVKWFGSDVTIVK